MGSPKQVIADQNCIRIVKSVQPAEVIGMIGDPSVRHVIQEDGWDFPAELEAAKTMIERPEDFISNPLSVILGRPQLAPGQSFHLSSQLDEKKTKTLFQFELFLTSLTGSRSIADQAMMIADEFYTNATKASKTTDSAGNLSSGANAGLANTGQVDFFSGTFGGRLVIGCRDPFGKLETSTIIERLTSCYQKGVAQSIRHGTGGAGIGTFMVFDACISYYAMVHKNHHSVVCAVLPLSSKRKDAEGLSKNIHLTEFE